ncbi:unnamed protein product [Ilex paraguariensis]|uniref:Peptidase C1A papain C-terminal domain-containing protein n=1 Tax=Ilex paraguariensis TaxID=185542 RepID=A0ABC8T939_9AQUA
MANFQVYLATLLLLVSISKFQLQVVALEPIPHFKSEPEILQGSIVRLINGNPKAGWKAAMSARFSNYTVGQFKYLLGVKPTPLRDLKSIPVRTHPKGANTFTSSVSSTVIIVPIKDQGHCGSCWAFGAVESLSDRFCIHFGMNISLSVNDLLACCGFMCGGGCDGGYPIYAWNYFVQNGVVAEECDPYFDNSGCSHPGCEPAYPTPMCERKCVKENLLWTESKHFSVNAYRIDSDPYNIMAEVYKNGPVEVSFTVYEDFAHYKSGVYKHMTGDVMGGHAVKLIGWGTTDDGNDYWLLANQWNRSWGDDGYFMIRRGSNECGIEEDVVAGTPSSRNLIKKFGNVDAFRDVSA